jgi:negative regulator of flagellin synthesis FlgM
MRVSGYGQKAVDKNQETRGAEKAEGTKGTSKKKEESKLASTDKVEVSSRAKEAAMAKAIAKDAPDVNDDKVEKLRNAIQSGTYKVDGKAIADRMVDEHLTAAF